MESYEATRAVFSRVQTIDPENASKIMGYILLYHGEKDMIRFAYGPETLIISIVNRAKTDLGLLSNTSCAPVISPISNPIAISRPNPLSLSLSSPRGYPSSPSSPSVWSPHPPSYASVLNNGGGNGSFSSSSIGSPQLAFSSVDDPFLTDPITNVDYFVDPYDRRTSSNSNSTCLNDMYYGTDDSTSGFGVKPCLYYARGFCKNGSSCRFVHGDDLCGGPTNGLGPINGVGLVGSPTNACKYDSFEQCQDEIFRNKLAHQQRLAAQLISGGVSLPYNKLNFLPSDAQRSAAAALMMGEEFHKLNRVRMARNEFAGFDSSPGARQIYLTFPADSTFKEEDVSDYFNKYGPVQDVRIPYQQKRMFGFVTFVYPETVKLILAKGNPHFVCDSRVLVKPYKEKGKIPDKKNQHHMDRGEFSCSSPYGHDCREPFDYQLGGRMFCSPQEMLLRKKLEEQADFQQALELEDRRLMNLQLIDLKNQQNQLNLSHVPSPTMLQASPFQSGLCLSSGISQDDEENKGSPTGASDEHIAEDISAALDDSNVLKKEDDPRREENEFSESLEHVLPDNLFASPKKSTSDIRPAAFTPALAELNNGSAITGSSLASDSIMPATASLSMPPLKSCFFEMPRISTGHEALGM